LLVQLDDFLCVLAGGVVDLERPSAGLGPDPAVDGLERGHGLCHGRVLDDGVRLVGIDPELDDLARLREVVFELCLGEGANEPADLEDVAGVAGRTNNRRAALLHVLLGNGPFELDILE